MPGIVPYNSLELELQFHIPHENYNCSCCINKFLTSLVISPVPYIMHQNAMVICMLYFVIPTIYPYTTPSNSEIVKNLHILITNHFSHSASSEMN